MVSYLTLRRRRPRSAITRCGNCSMRPPARRSRRWMVEQSFAWATRRHRLVKDHERYASTLAGFHVVAFVGDMLKHTAELIRGS